MAYSIQQLHRMFIPMLQEFDSFCREHGLRYFLDGGTLLGAVRDGGFIPWDDDVDIVMPRPDYERLICEWNGSMSLLCHEKDCEYVFPYIKLFHPVTPVVEIQDEEFRIQSKVFLKIDLYPMDGVSPSKHSAFRQGSIVKLWKKWLFLRIDKQESRNIFKRFAYKCLRLIPTNFFYNRLDSAMKMYDYESSRFVTRWRTSNGAVSIFEKNVVEPLSVVSFENERLSCPADYDTYLTKTYGDYMQLVRQNEGLRHSTTASSVASDLENYISIK